MESGHTSYSFIIINLPAYESTSPPPAEDDLPEGANNNSLSSHPHQALQAFLNVLWQNIVKK